jgi:hypothetical protein
MDRRGELAVKERAGWDAFLAVVGDVPDERRSDPGVVPGWSVKDLVWHCAGWARFAGDHLEAIGGGTFTDPFAGTDDAHWDRVSQEMIDASRSMSFDEVVAGAEAERLRLHGIWSSLPEIGDEAARWFSEETFVHYDEHAEEIRHFLQRT